MNYVTEREIVGNAASRSKREMWDAAWKQALAAGLVDVLAFIMAEGDGFESVTDGSDRAERWLKRDHYTGLAERLIASREEVVK